MLADLNSILDTEGDALANAREPFEPRYVARRLVSPIVLGSTPFGFADLTHDLLKETAWNDAG